MATVLSSLQHQTSGAGDYIEVGRATATVGGFGQIFPPADNRLCITAVTSSNTYAVLINTDGSNSTQYFLPQYPNTTTLDKVINVPIYAQADGPAADIDIQYMIERVHA